MTPYVVKLLSQEDVIIFHKIKDVINRLPDIDFGKDVDGKPILLSCHILARAISEVFGLQTVDGLFFNLYQHSWVLTNNLQIIDVYPVAILGGPFLFDRVNFFGAEELYKQAKIPVDFQTDDFIRSVHIVIEQIKLVLPPE